MSKDGTIDIDFLSAHERALKEQIAQLEDFVQNGPERERQALQEEMSTLPPPSDLIGRKREMEFMEKLSRGELKNQRRTQAKSGFLLLLLCLAIAMLGWWIYQIIQ